MMPSYYLYSMIDIGPSFCPPSRTRYPSFVDIKEVVVLVSFLWVALIVEWIEVLRLGRVG